MKQLSPIIIILFLILAFSGFGGFIYTVDETQQVIITQFGEPLGQPIRKAGLRFKMPWQKANYFDKRILQWDGDPNQIPTADKRFIWVDTTARWKIVDPLKFMQSVGTELGAQTRLDDILDSATRDAISKQNLIEAIRDSNNILLNDGEEAAPYVLANVYGSESSREKISFGREKITREILLNASKIVPNYGIEIVDIRIKRINYVQKVQNKVFERMISEYKRAAELFRSEGQGKKAEIQGQQTKELQAIQSEAYRKAQEVKGKADAEATNIYAEAYMKDPDFYAFLKTLETYRETINEDSVFMLTTESDFYKFLKNIDVRSHP